MKPTCIFIHTIRVWVLHLPLIRLVCYDCGSLNSQSSCIPPKEIGYLRRTCGTPDKNPYPYERPRLHLTDFVRLLSFFRVSLFLALRYCSLSHCQGLLARPVWLLAHWHIWRCCQTAAPQPAVADSEYCGHHKSVCWMVPLSAVRLAWPASECHSWCVDVVW